jgi:CxC2 like cysteine cluster associated with KDZ transposases
VPLIDLGLHVQLGHNGGPCAAPCAFNAPLVVYHTNGAHLVNISYCQCNEPASGYLFANQLLRSAWFPASLTRPRTMFTFAVLKHFHHLTLQGKTTAYDFYNSLVHETDNTGLKPPRVNLLLSLLHVYFS